jgi:hypothetical protein
LGSRVDTKLIDTNGVNLFEAYINDAYQSIEQINKERYQKTSSGISGEYNNEVELLMFDNYCTNYLMPELGYECDQELLNVGLETTSIHILERSRKILEEFLAGAMNKEDSVAIVNGEEYKQLGKKYLSIYLN